MIYFTRFVCVVELLLFASIASAGLRITAPLDYQVIQRISADGGSVEIDGEWSEGFLAGDVVEARLSDGNAAAEWQRVVSPLPGRPEFRAELNSSSGGWFQLEVRIRRDGKTVAETQVPHVGVGEVFVIAGQSNSANHGEEKQVVRSGLVTTFSGNAWRIANDPQPGASGDGGSFIPAFADAIAKQFGVPVGVVATGAGGTSVREWLPRGIAFPNPPTITNNVIRSASGAWECNGRLFDQLILRMRSLGSGGFRAVLWHQGESDANQSDPSRTLPGDLYRKYLAKVIQESRAALGWDVPWFVAQASYHTPDDPGSPDIRSAQAALWKVGVALEGPDTDALTREWREMGGKGVHFSGPGLRKHGTLWAEKVAPWLSGQLAENLSTRPFIVGATSRLVLQGMENFTVAGHRAFLFLPDSTQRETPQPWIFYAPTLPGYPDGVERWMHEQFLKAGIAVAGVDVGEAYGSPASLDVFDALHDQFVNHRGFAPKACLLGRSRGGLAVGSWAIARPDHIAGIAGIYPVFDLRSYPGLAIAAPAYGLSVTDLETRAKQLNPVARLGELARAKIPALLIHGDQDTVVPLQANSGAFMQTYRAAGVDGLAELIALPGQGHSFYPGFFHSQDLVNFAIDRARAGSGK